MRYFLAIVLAIFMSAGGINRVSANPFSEVIVPGVSAGDYKIGMPMVDAADLLEDEYDEVAVPREDGEDRGLCDAPKGSRLCVWDGDSDAGRTPGVVFTVLVGDPNYSTVGGTKVGATLQVVVDEFGTPENVYTQGHVILIFWESRGIGVVVLHSLELDSPVVLVGVFAPRKSP